MTALEAALQQERAKLLARLVVVLVDHCLEDAYADWYGSPKTFHGWVAWCRCSGHTYRGANRSAALAGYAAHVAAMIQADATGEGAKERKEGTP